MEPKPKEVAPLVNPLEASSHELVEAALDWARPVPAPGAATRYLSAVERHEQRLRRGPAGISRATGLRLLSRSLRRFQPKSR